MTQHRQIPPGVYWSREAGNFYDASTSIGMGVEFYAEWQERKDEFPARATSSSGLDIYMDKPVRTLNGENGAAGWPLCSDCPPIDYPTDKTRCAPCPRRSHGEEPKR